MTAETSCGIWGLYPKCLQRLANSKCFIIVYGFLGTVQSMAFVYFVVSLTTMEKRFKIPTRTSGIMLSGNEISQILLSLFLSYYGGQKNRPRWLAWGVFISGLSCFILAMPHFLFGEGEEIRQLTKEYEDMHPNGSSIDANNTKNSMCSPLRTNEECKTNDYLGEYSLLPVILVFISQFVLGIGNTLYYSLGNTYMDDNTKKTNMPRFLGYSFALRTLGPALGFLIGPLCLKIFINPSLTPLILKDDHRWLGAWWLGWIIFGLLLVVFSGLVGMFPKQLPKKIVKKPEDDLPQYPKITCLEPKTNDELPLSKQSNGTVSNVETEDKYVPTLKEFPQALNRLLKNKLLMINIASTILYVCAGSGYMTFIPKYFEIQYNKASMSSMLIAGPSTICSALLGFLLSGWFISKKRPRASVLLSWNVIGGVVFLIVEIAFIFLSCPKTSIETQLTLGNRMDFTNECNLNCMCNDLQYNPVCHKPTGEIFYSPCHAGCQEQDLRNQVYTNCTCVANPMLLLQGNYNSSIAVEAQTNVPDKWDAVQAGSCSVDCSAPFHIFILLNMIANFMVSSGKIGNVLINYRCVEKRDKAFGQGMLLLMISLFALIPSPIIYGAIFDSTCLEWSEKCGKRNNCLIYDKDKLRLAINLTAFGFTFFAVILDGFVAYLSRNVTLYDEDDADTQIKIEHK